MVNKISSTDWSGAGGVAFPASASVRQYTSPTAPSRYTGPCALVRICGCNAAEAATCAANFASSTHSSHGVLLMFIAKKLSSNISAGISRESYTAPGKNDANESTPHSTPVDPSNNARVDGESNNGGRTAVSVRSDSTNDSPSF